MHTNVPTQPAAPGPSAQEGTLIGPYKLLQKLGEGGFGEVWMAEQKQPVKRRVAVKIIKLGMDTRQVVARFEAERQALAMMDHPHIAKVLDAGATDAGRPFFVMELVRGIPVTQYCDENSASTPERLRLFVQVCQAIQHAHQKGVIHRDIKPSNILVTMHDGVPVPKVIDFGIAKATQQDLTDKTLFTHLQQFIGTPAYMSPEQAEMSGIDIDTRSDIYSLGVLFYELLTGRTPFDARELSNLGVEGMRRVIRENEPPRPSTRVHQLKGDDLATTANRRRTVPPKLVSALKGDLDWIAMKCLEKDRTRRYETANGLAADINRYLANEPILARPPSTAYRLRKSVLKHKAASAVAAAIFLFATMAAVISTASLISEKKAHAEAEKARHDLQFQRDRAETARLEAERQRALAQTNLLAARASEERAERALYAADMLLVERAMADGNLGHANRLLNKYGPSTNSAGDLRGWEWRHYREQARGQELCTLSEAGADWIVATARSDGAVAAIASNGRVELHDPGTRRILAAESLPLRGHELPPFNAQAKFTKDGFFVATAGFQLFVMDGGNLRLLKTKNFDDWILALEPSLWGADLVVQAASRWEGLSLPGLESRPIERPWKGDVAFSINRDFAYVYRDSKMEVWDAKTFQLVASNRVSCAGLAVGIQFSPNGRWCVESGYLVKPMAIIRQTETGEEIRRLEGFGGWVVCAAWSADSRFLALGSRDQRIYLYKTGSWELKTARKGHHNEVTAMAFSSDGKLLVTGDKSGSLKAWMADDSGAGLGEVQTLTNGGWISGSGASAGVQAANGKLKILELPAFRPLGRHEHSASAFDSTGSLFAENESGRLVVRSRGGAEQFSVVTPAEASILALGLDPAGEWLAATSTNRLFLWELKTGRATQTDLGLLPFRIPTDIEFGPKGERTVVLADDLAILFDAPQLSHRRILKHPTGATGSAFSPDGRWLATTCYDAAVRVWNVETGSLISILQGQRFADESCAFSKDGTRLAVGGFDGSIRLWETKDWHQVGQLPFTRETDQGGVSSIAFGPNDTYLAAANGKQIKVFQAPK